MSFLSVKETATLWGVSERSVRGYCAAGRVPGAFLTGKTWNIPEGAVKPKREGAAAGRTLLSVLKDEKDSRLHGGIYHRVQIELTYNSNHIEGSGLTREQTRCIFETDTLGVTDKSVRVDDIIETANHFRCIDEVIDCAKRPLTERFIKRLHLILKTGTDDAGKAWFAVGEYKKLPNEVGGRETTLPEDVPAEMKRLISDYNGKGKISLDDILEFHVRFERIHPFQDGNGRIGRLIMFKECLKNGIVPFIIEDGIKLFYYRGLAEWPRERGYLTDTCLSAQDAFKNSLRYFRIQF